MTKLKITKFVLKRLENIKTQCSGSLFGFVYQGTLLILGFNVETVNGSLKYKQVQYNFPTEVDLCGLVKFGLCTDAEAHMSDILRDIDITDNPILLTCDVGTLVGLKASLYKHGQFEEIPFEVMDDDELFREFYMANLNCSLQIVCDETEQSIAESMLSLRKSLASGSVAFSIKNTSVYLTGGSLGSSIHGIDLAASTEDLLNLSKQTIGDCFVQKVKKNKYALSKTEHDVIFISMLIKKTKDKTDENLNRSSGKITVDKSEKFKKNEIPLHVNALSMIYRETKAIDLYDILVESICNALRLIENNLIDQFKVYPEQSLKVLEGYNFFPVDFGHFFTCLYPHNIFDEDPTLVQKRKRLHHHFGLPLTKPLFRRTNFFKFQNKSNLLVNPHIGLKNQIPGGKQYLVSGKYSYHHYMQDNFDDNGWGCAYRSLQTLCSWFCWQGYSNIPIPIHEEIQKYLVEIGDKPKSFVGSKQWIGSTEVSMCLNYFMKVDSRIMFVASGKELAHKGSELAIHFETQGTPIMIGGGVLAHTILGIDYNQTTGELKFLILDPHYTGTEDIGIVQSKGWCGWKNSDFWDKTAYYNLCMPQRPIIF